MRKEYVPSRMAVLKYPDVYPEHYFTDADYDAAIKRILIKRKDYDRLNKKRVNSEKPVPKNLSVNAPKPICIEGKVYVSIGEASKDIGLSRASIRRRLESSDLKFFEWYFVEEDGNV